MQESTGVETNAGSPEAWKSFETFAQGCLDREMWTGGVIAAGTPAGESFRRAWGWMDTDKAIPMPDNALFDLASVTKAVGTLEDPRPDFWLVPRELGDRLLLCSDGITSELNSTLSQADYDGVRAFFEAFDLGFRDPDGHLWGLFWADPGVEPPASEAG